MACATTPGRPADRRLPVRCALWRAAVDWPSGLLDAYLAVNCNRDPRDGLLDVFTEDNVNQRLIWHRVDDRDITTTEGKLVVK
jgi:hypothetical protein